MALLADAAHNFGDVLGLLLGWGATWLTRLPPTRRRTYGWGRSSILAALLNATILLIGVGAIGVEAVQRLLAPMPVMERTVILVAAAGIVVNGATALLFLRGRGDDINLRAQFLHMAADAGVSAAVVVAGLLIMVTGLAVARSAGEPRDRHRHRSDHLGTAARIDRSVDGRGARRRGA